MPLKRNIFAYHGNVVNLSTYRWVISVLNIFSYSVSFFKAVEERVERSRLFTARSFSGRIPSPIGLPYQKNTEAQDLHTLAFHPTVQPNTRGLLVMLLFRFASSYLFSTIPCKSVPSVRLERTTFRFVGECSIHWAKKVSIFTFCLFLSHYYRVCRQFAKLKERLRKIKTTVDSNGYAPFFLPCKGNVFLIKLTAQFLLNILLLTFIYYYTHRF